MVNIDDENSKPLITDMCSCMFDVDEFLWYQL